MTTVAELERLLHVEEIHTSNFSDWERRATDPFARLVFKMAADKEANHVKWVKLLLDIARQRKRGDSLGVGVSDLEFWVNDETGEGDSYTSLAEKAEEPWMRAVLTQLAADEKSNAELLDSLLAYAAARKAT